MPINTNVRRDAKTRYLAALPPEAISPDGPPREAIEALEQALVGCVALPGTPRYFQGSSEYPASPKLITYCAVFEDVRLSLEFAHKWSLPATCRSGGHSTAGFSVNDGIVIDLSGINYVVVDRDQMQARVGAGAQFHELNSVLNTYQVHIPGGTCPDVAVAGFNMGGGYGLTSREFGVGCDQVIGATVMLADGSLVMANADTNPDLFWAIRGGTGGQFGVVLDITFKVQPVQNIWGFAMQWSIEDAPAALVELQNHYMLDGDAPDQFGYLGILMCPEADLSTPALVAICMFNGPAEARDAAIAPLQAVAGWSWAKYSVGPNAGSPAEPVWGPYSKLNESMFDVLPGVPGGNPADMKKPPIVHLQPPGPIAHACGGAVPSDGPVVGEVKNSRYLGQALSLDQWTEITQYYATTPNPYNIVNLEPYGGAISAKDEFFNAFVHRSVYTDFVIDSFWVEGWKYNDKDQAQAWLDGFMDLVGPMLADEMYQNYPIRNLPDYRWMFFRDGYNSLLFVKQKYDPNHFFEFEQAITPYPDDPGIHKSTVPSMFSDPVIQYPPWVGD